MHYKNGREAKVGDPVVGKVYNTPGIVAGTLVSLTPGVDSCSAMVEFFAVTGSAPNHETPRMAILPYDRHQVIRGTQHHGSDGPSAATYRCCDYTHAGNLLHAEDAHKALFEWCERNPSWTKPAADHPAAEDQA